MKRRFSRRSILRAAAVLAVGATFGPGLPTLARETDSIPLIAGLNAHTWCGPDMPIADATSRLPLRIAYEWDNVERRWRAYAPNTTINSIGLLRHGQPIILMMTADADWSQPRYRGALPQAEELTTGWSFLGWSGLHEPVWTAFGQEALGSVAEARRWNTDLQEWITYTPGQPAEQLFAILHPGDAVWARMRIGGARWNPASGIIEPDRASRLVQGEITYYHPSLAGGPMYCTGKPYDPQDVTVGAAVAWPCGTRLRIWRDERFVDVVVQDTGLLGHNHVDLSEAAFQRLAILPEGRVSVLIEVLAGPE
jgi:hypothetical protein